MGNSRRFGAVKADNLNSRLSCPIFRLSQKERNKHQEPQTVNARTSQIDRSNTGASLCFSLLFFVLSHFLFFLSLYMYIFPPSLSFSFSPFFSLFFFFSLFRKEGSEHIMVFCDVPQIEQHYTCTL